MLVVNSAEGSCDLRILQHFQPLSYQQTSRYARPLQKSSSI
jgi:hypothetical protein